MKPQKTKVRIPPRPLQRVLYVKKNSEFRIRREGELETPNSYRIQSSKFGGAFMGVWLKNLKPWFRIHNAQGSRAEFRIQMPSEFIRDPEFSITRIDAV